MDKIFTMLEGKKTYISAIVLAGLGAYGFDTSHGWDAATVSNAVGMALATAGVIYGRWSATKPKKSVKKTRKPRTKKVKVDA